MPLSLLNILKRPLRVSGRKALAMSRSPITTAPTGDDRLGRLIDVVGQLAQQQKSLLESLRT